MPKLLPRLLTVLAFFVAIVLLALWEIGWKFAALPTWFYAYALAAAVVTFLASRLRLLDNPERPDWQRVVLLGLSWGISVMALMSGRELLAGHWQKPGALVTFVAVWLVGSLVYGAISVAGSRGKSKAGKVVRDWL